MLCGNKHLIKTAVYPKGVKTQNRLPKSRFKGVKCKSRRKLIFKMMLELLAKAGIQPTGKYFRYLIPKHM